MPVASSQGPVPNSNQAYRRPQYGAAAAPQQQIAAAAYPASAAPRQQYYKAPQAQPQGQPVQQRNIYRRPADGQPQYAQPAGAAQQRPLNQPPFVQQPWGYQQGPAAAPRPARPAAYVDAEPIELDGVRTVREVADPPRPPRPEHFHQPDDHRTAAAHEPKKPKKQWFIIAPLAVVTFVLTLAFGAAAVASFLGSGASGAASAVFSLIFTKAQADYMWVMAESSYGLLYIAIMTVSLLMLTITLILLGSQIAKRGAYRESDYDDEE